MSLIGSTVAAANGIAFTDLGLSPTVFEIGWFQLRWYSIAYLAGIFIGYWYLLKLLKQPGAPMARRHADDLVFYAALGIILGGRLGYVLFYNLPYYIEHPVDILKLWDGGMSFHGGLIGVVVAAWWWSRRHRLHLMDTVDFLAPLVPPGLGFGRLGNYIGGELWGKPTEAGWGVVFPRAPEFSGWSMEQIQAQFATGALNQYARHPSQLYQAFLEGLVMFAALWWFSSRPRPRYAVSGLFALLYGVFRFLVEFVRVPDEQLQYLAFGWLTMGQLLSVPLILLGLYLLWLSRRSPVLQPVVPAKESA